jgi:DNA-binding PadR family transcriptional regulator
MTDAELTILSLMAEGPRYGYEIQQIIDERGLREWLTVGFSSIYYILNKLERQDMLNSELRSYGRSAAHKVYRITDAGLGVLQTAVSDLLRQPRSLGTGFELGLANLGALKPGQVYQVLTHHRNDLRQRLEAVQRSYDRHQSDDNPQVPEHIRALYTHSVAMMQAELEWMEAFLTDWETRYPAVARTPVPEEAPEDRPVNKLTTQIHRRTTPDAAKMIQKLKRPKPPTAE